VLLLLLLLLLLLPPLAPQLYTRNYRRSSRAHAVVLLTLVQRYRGRAQRSTLFLVDLGGSEQVSTRRAASTSRAPHRVGGKIAHVSSLGYF